VIQNIGKLPSTEELNWNSENPNEQPSNPGIILFSADYLRDGVCACRCTRNLRLAEKWIKNAGGKIVAAYPVNDRDTQGRKIGRYIKKCVSMVTGNSTTFYFKFDEKVKGFMNEMREFKEHSFKSVRQALKALVRNAIQQVSDKTKRSVMSVKDVVNVTFPQVDGLTISTYLRWLADDGMIKYYENENILSGRIKLV